MKGRFALKPRARTDLEEIWEYTADLWGPDQAEKYIRQLQEDIQTVADNPAFGHDCEVVRAGYRKFPSGSHVLFYRLAEGGIEIVRILHERMDYGRHIP